MINNIIEQKEICYPDNTVDTGYYLPKENIVKEKRWRARVYVVPNMLFMIDFFLNAIEPYNDEVLHGYTFCDDKINIEIIEKSSKGIHDFIYSMGMEGGCVPHVEPAVITNSTFDYLFIKEMECEVFCMFGDDEFIKKVMPVSFDTYSIYYEDYQSHWTSASDFMKWFWKTYPK